MKVKFYPENHQYFDERGREYISVNKLMDQHMETFDTETVANKVINMQGSIYYGKTKKEVLQIWNTIKETGTEVHKVIENHIKNNIKPLKESFKSIVQKFYELSFEGTLLSETIVYDETNLIAGTIDIIEQQPNLLKVWDIKTSRKLTDDKYYRYTVQLEFYRYLLSLLVNDTVKIGGIIWIEDFFHLQGNAPIKKMCVDSCNMNIHEMINARKIELWKRSKKYE